jgi:asparagine synthase (glutamine-hydrolysing)
VGPIKVILREAFADILPVEIKARGKMGFGIPFGTWFRGELRDYLHDLLLAAGARYGEYLSLSHMRALVELHVSGRADLGLQLWSILCFEVWLRLLPVW